MKDGALTKLTLFALGMLSGLIVAGIVVLMYQPKPASNLKLATPVPTSIKVYVMGAVARPGVYELYPGDRVEQAIEAAGGPLETADLQRVNLAQRLRDEMQVLVPSKVSETVAPSGKVSGGSSPTGSAKVNVNLASPSELESLPGIGPVLAQRIVEYREQNGPYNGPEDLIKVRGISRGLVERLADQITY